MRLWANSVIFHERFRCKTICDDKTMIRFVTRTYPPSLDWRRSFCDIATRITGEEISVSNKHLDQNERLDDFGSRARPQFFYLTIIWIFMKWNARAQWWAGKDLDCSPVSPMWMVESSFVYDDWFVAAWKITLFPNPVGKFTSRYRDLQQNYVLQLFDVF